MASSHSYSWTLREHGERTARICDLLADDLELTKRERETVTTAAYLHDIGKLFVPVLILQKPGDLTHHERSIIRQHPPIGEACLSAFPALSDVARLVGQHHERLDGRGYPRGLSAREIDPLARIVSAADAFVAMTEDRPYQAAVSVDEALGELRAGCGTQFDHRVVEALERAILVPLTR